MKSLGIMTTEHPRWEEFLDRLDGSEGCNFYEDDEGNLRWICDASNHDCPLTSKILKDMGATESEIRQSREYFHSKGGGCDCEILFNIDSE